MLNLLIDINLNKVPTPMQKIFVSFLDVLFACHCSDFYFRFKMISDNFTMFSFPGVSMDIGHKFGVFLLCCKIYANIGFFSLNFNCYLAIGCTGELYAT